MIGVNLGCMILGASMRQGVTVEFDERYYEVLERWAKFGYQSSIAILVEWLVAQVIDEREPTVPPEAGMAPIHVKMGHIS